MKWMRSPRQTSASAPSPARASASVAPWTSLTTWTRMRGAYVGGVGSVRQRRVVDRLLRLAIGLGARAGRGSGRRERHRREQHEEQRDRAEREEQHLAPLRLRVLDAGDPPAER